MNQLNEKLLAEITKNINVSIAAHFEKMTQRLMGFVNEKISKHRQIDYQSLKEKRRLKQALKKQKVKLCLRERILALQEMYSKLQRNSDNIATIQRQSQQINLKREYSEESKINSNINEFLYQRFAEQKMPYMVKKYPLASRKAINRLLLKRWRRMPFKTKELYRKNAQVKINENEQECSPMQAVIKIEIQSQDQDRMSIYSNQTSKMALLAGEMENFTLEDEQQFTFDNQNERELKDSNFKVMQVPKQVANEEGVDPKENEERQHLKEEQINE